MSKKPIQDNHNRSKKDHCTGRRSNDRRIADRDEGDQQGSDASRSRGVMPSSVFSSLQRSRASPDHVAPTLRATTSLTQLNRNIGTGYGGSNSVDAIDPRTGRADVLADMTGFIRHVDRQNTSTNMLRGLDEGEDHSEADSDGSDSSEGSDPDMGGTPSDAFGSNAGDFHNPSLRLISRSGDRLGSSDIHRDAMTLLWQHMDGVWPEFKCVPISLLRMLFKRFGTQYRWNPGEHEHTFKGFRNTLAHRYRDRMSAAREESKKHAIKAGKIVGNINDHFDILKDHHPNKIPDKIWRGLCAKWDTPEWKAKSESMKRNRNTPDASGRLGRYTGGSIGVAEHRERLKAKFGRVPSWLEVFMQTHLTAESKARWHAGARENLIFVSQTAQDLFEAYQAALYQKYGEDQTLHVDDFELWDHVQAHVLRRSSTARVYGIGYSDAHYAVIGAFSSSSGTSLYNAQTEEVRNLRTQLQEMEGNMQRRQQEMENTMQIRQQEMQAQMQTQLQAQMQAQFEEFKKNMQKDQEKDPSNDN